MAHGRRRKGAGRPKGSVSTKTLAEREAQELVRAEITKEHLPIIRAAIQRAKGLSYLVSRDEKSGRFVRVTEQTLEDADTAMEVWEKEPDMAAIHELLDRL